MWLRRQQAGGRYADRSPLYAPPREKPLPAIRGSRARRRRGSQAALSIIAGIYLTLSTVVAAGAAHVLHQRSFASLAAPPASAKYLVLMVLDGGRPDYFGVTPLPHVDALRARGTQFTDAVDGILEAETPAGHATIATGSPPARDGILGFDWANDDNRYSLFNPDQMGTVEQIMEKTGTPTIASLFKARHRHASVVALSGHKYYAAAPLGGPDADAIMYYEGDSKGRYVPVAVPGHTPPASVLNAPGVISPTTKNGAKGEDTLATRLAIAAFRRMHQRITLINYPHFDWPLGHVYGGMLDRPRVAEVMKGFDHDLGLIEDAYRKAGVLDRTLFVITSDHGMMPIRHYVPESLIDSAIQRAGTTAPDIAADSAEYVWLADPSKAKTVATIVAGAHNREVQSAYYLTERNGAPTYVRASASKLSGADESANQMLLRAMINGHEPDVVVFAANGATFTSPDSHWKGDHGGNQWASQHIPLVLSGPGIRSGVVSHDPVQLEDVAPTVLADLGVRPTGMSGHVLTEALISPSSARLKARRAEVRGIAPMVRALKSAN